MCAPPTQRGAVPLALVHAVAAAQPLPAELRVLGLVSGDRAATCWLGTEGCVPRRLRDAVGRSAASRGLCLSGPPSDVQQSWQNGQPRIYPYLQLVPYLLSEGT